MAFKPVTEPRIHGSYALLPDPDGGHMVWPSPAATGDIEYRLRYGPPLTRSELLFAASVLAAYRQLIELPQRTRNQRVSEIRAALSSSSEEAGR